MSFSKMLSKHSTGLEITRMHGDKYQIEQDAAGHKGFLMGLFTRSVAAMKSL